MIFLGFFFLAFVLLSAFCVLSLAEILIFGINLGQDDISETNNSAVCSHSSPSPYIASAPRVGRYEHYSLSWVIILLILSQRHFIFL